MLDDDTLYIDELEELWKAQVQCLQTEEAFVVHSAPAPQVFTELKSLAIATGDIRFVEAAIAIYDNQLVDANSNWRRDIPVWPLSYLLHKKAIIPEAVSIFLKRGATLRYACSVTASITGWNANSFEAAVKSVERMWRSHSAKSGDGTWKTAIDSMFEKTYHLPEIFTRLKQLSELSGHSFPQDELPPDLWQKQTELCEKFRSSISSFIQGLEDSTRLENSEVVSSADA